MSLSDVEELIGQMKFTIDGISAGLPGSSLCKLSTGFRRHERAHEPMVSMGLFRLGSPSLGFSPYLKFPFCTVSRVVGHVFCAVFLPLHAASPASGLASDRVQSMVFPGHFAPTHPTTALQTRISEQQCCLRFN